MDRWKAEMGRVREEKRRQEERRSKRESVRRKKIQVWKGRKVARNCVFQWFVTPESRKVGSLKRRVRSQLARWELKNCTPLWREELRSTFRSCDVEKVHAVVARRTSPSQNVKNTPGSDHVWKLRWWKSAHRCGAKCISKSKVQKTQGYGALLDVQMSFRVAGARDCAPCQEWAKRVEFCSISKTMAGVGHMQRIWQDAFRVAGAVQETCSSELLGGPVADFLRGCILGHQSWDDFAWQVQHFVRPGITFSWQAQ